MKQGFIFVLTILISFSLLAQDWTPTQRLTETEKNEIIKKYGEEGDSFEKAWAKFLEAKKKEVATLRSPSNIATTPAEFEKSDGVCFSWRGYSTLLTELVTEVAKDAKAYVATTNSSYVSSQLKNAGCNMDNVVFLDTYLNSVWMRDYGPWFIYTSDNRREVIDLLYNRPRPDDDKFPTYLANKFGWGSHPCKLILPGGNLIVDGMGVAIMTDVTFDPAQGGDPNLSVEALKIYMKTFFNCDKTYIVKDLQNDGTGHIDMFCKLLDERNIIVGEYARPSDGYGDNYHILNEIAEQLSEMTNGKGEKFIVHRIPMPPYRYGTSYTHTNSLIVNKKVLVPVYGLGTDEAALDVYRKLLPGYKICGFDCNRIIGANGAIHCITKLIMSDPATK